MRARPTIYSGIRMRSRLEAAFAEELDNEVSPTGEVESWEYEPYAYASSQGQYLPDFAVQYLFGKAFVEVKPPNADFDAALARMHIIHESEPETLLSVATRWSEHDRFQVVRRCWNTFGCLCLPCQTKRCEKCGSPDSHPLPERIEHGELFQDHECSDCGWLVSARVPAAPTT